MHHDGLVVLENVVDRGHLDVLNETMQEDAMSLYGRKDSPANYHRDNLQQDPPVNDRLFFDDIFLSESSPGRALDQT